MARPYLYLTTFIMSQQSDNIANNVARPKKHLKDFPSLLFHMANINRHYNYNSFDDKKLTWTPYDYFSAGSHAH